MRKYFSKIILFILIFTVVNFSQSIEKYEAKHVAKNWLKENAEIFFEQLSQNLEIDDSENVITLKDFDDKIIGFGINLKPKGFVIINQNKKQKPIFGFSLNGKLKKSDFEDEHNFIFNLLQKKYLVDSKAINDNQNSIKITQHQDTWEKYLETEYYPNKPKSTKTIYGPFLNSDWGQGYVSGMAVYNYYTPNQWPAGCVATATAQILNYYKWPIRGLGSHGYTDNNTGYQYCDFYNTIYDWENTLDEYENVLLTTAQRQAAGLLTYHAAVSLNMDFELEGSESSTSDVPGVLQSYFRFSGHYKSSTSPGFWNELKSNIIDARPSIISISGTGIGHAAVVDGYSEANDYYHVNPGWYGDYNGWYDISDSWNMSGYNYVVGAVKGIIPSPMINIDVERIDSLSFILSWQRSINENADFYELQQSTAFGGPWTTLSSSIVDSFYTVTIPTLQSYYYRVRSNRDGIWWDYSYPKKVTLAEDLTVKFIVDMNAENLEENDEVVIRGNIPPLSGSANSEPLTDIDGDGIYELSVTFDFDYANTELVYRYFIQKPAQLIAENFNRTYMLSMESEQNLDTAVFNIITNIEDENEIPTQFKLYQNYPNPFSTKSANSGGTGNPSTTIKFSIPNVFARSETTKQSDEIATVYLAKGGSQVPRNDNVRLTIYNALGQQVAELINKPLSAGNHQVQFNAKNLPNGIYFYRLQSGKYTQTKKMILLK